MLAAAASLVILSGCASVRPHGHHLYRRQSPRNCDGRSDGDKNGHRQVQKLVRYGCNRRRKRRSRKEKRRHHESLFRRLEGKEHLRHHRRIRMHRKGRIISLCNIKNILRFAHTTKPSNRGGFFIFISSAFFAPTPPHTFPLEPQHTAVVIHLPSASALPPAATL